MFYTLLSLQEENYGYEIMNFVKELTEDRVNIGPGTLYALLSRFQKENLIEQVSDDGNRKTYIITDLGQEILQGEIERLKTLLEDGRKILEEKEKLEIKEEKESPIFKTPNDEDMFF